MTKEYNLIRDLIANTPSYFDSDIANICTLRDTIYVLSKKNPDWFNDEFCKMIFAWNSSLYSDDHVDEVCLDFPIELKELCLEYRNHHTMNGSPLSESFGIEAIDYIFEPFKPKDDAYFESDFGTSPVSNAYFQLEYEND